MTMTTTMTMTNSETDTRPRRLTTDDINSIIETQLEVWPMARENFERLRDTRRKPLPLGDFPAAAQLNPARIKSTGAKIDKASIESRPCFLCSKNRPAEQISIPWMRGWELLVNPYPILPVHFTIASTEHRPQDRIPLEMAAMAEAAPDLVIFFNGARAGASAPDHLHLQGVLKTELPLIRIAEENHREGMPPIVWSDSFGLDLPYGFYSAVITPDERGAKTLLALTQIKGTDAETGLEDAGLVNAFFWTGSDGLLRAAVVPRRRHRPSCYAATGDEQITVSPGAIDIAGLLILPITKDFEKTDAKTAKKIYQEVC